MLVASFGFGGALRRKGHQRLAFEPPQVGLEPALLQPVHPRQCLVERLQRLAEIFGAEVKPSQQAEKAGGVLLDAHGLDRRQALAELGNARLDRPALPDRPAVQDGGVRGPGRQAVVCCQFHQGPSPRFDHPWLAKHLMEPARQVQGLACRKGMAQLIGGGECFSAAHYRLLRIAPEQED